MQNIVVLLYKSDQSTENIRIGNSIPSKEKRRKYLETMGLPPDANIHPTATGRAKELVDKHSKEQPLKLYSGWFCPYVSSFIL